MLRVCVATCVVAVLLASQAAPASALDEVILPPSDSKHAGIIIYLSESRCDQSPKFNRYAGLEVSESRCSLWANRVRSDLAVSLVEDSEYEFTVSLFYAVDSGSALAACSTATPDPTMVMKLDRSLLMDDECYNWDEAVAGGYITWVDSKDGMVDGENIRSTPILDRDRLMQAFKVAGVRPVPSFGESVTLSASIAALGVGGAYAAHRSGRKAGAKTRKAGKTGKAKRPDSVGSRSSTRLAKGSAGSRA